MQNNDNDLLADVAKYYDIKLAEHGDTPKGVDWNGEESQILRFLKLSTILDEKNNFSLNDLGCGYGALYDFLAKKNEKFSYLGIDVSENMIRAAMLRHKDSSQARFILSKEPDHTSDYGIASGIFNVRLGRSDDEWWAYLEATLDILDKTSSIGFAFNCLTSYSDANKMHDYLYYANPGALFDLCKRRYSRNVALLHDYGLYEFTILVRK
ncbi:class I SAM-dependent methyltransferase [Herbaspirillum sp. RTI4]|uniref:class I SAM-dependent methyltransferase n=1 Tax=Herbaspirillum sp. RTI4 TaxID=3048640 RepID=UPI002AB4E8AE|nr:class I SAM-dependent methyltransferase [Herbaspirillum sp. RTI4]MDY7577589.1 class I SAM-dependent methyltransferase [Herbaspirillum sp. RTI4]MEA9983390.1 class I SAM-dependent methyltransferase [Herbaspirillum sp. RTI4]